ncbi:AB hydrolase-1 domain-containing protein [Mycena venus]|uniref:AB hydrolase-1 domain-containing protein n=1 Tax=Mycena venus TaxID=2733690 RepID=A0A8H7DAN0_9AGAR|nr:AB hydrolase-1 domain-containing protein [Mycena venus]
MFLPIRLLVSCLLLLPAVVAVLFGPNSETFRWDQLRPSTNLNWVECYSMFQCAKLEVPLDYSDPNVGTAALAVIRLPANVSEEEYQGPVLFNPGGPGGSGVDALVGVGSSFRVFIGNQYDIVSFDPRGVSYSTPIATFFKTDAERALWNAAAPPEGSLNASSDAIQRNWGLAQLLGQLAVQRDSSGIFKYMTTDNVARDMLLISQKFGFDRLKYYGISYGSALGATFAALFPDKVERIIIDGVLDVDAWFKANLTISATDTDKVLQAFFNGCAAAGPELCAFYKPTAAEIAERLAALTASIRARPVPVITPTSYGVVDYTVLRVTLFESFKMPYDLFPTVAKGLAELESGNGTLLYSIFANAPFECDSSTDDALPFHLNSDEALIAVHCSDAVEVKDSIEQFTAFVENAAKTSQFAEFLVDYLRVNCDGWQIHREGRFLGPITAEHTRVPLLIVTTTADPVTPKAGALNTLAGFPGSVLLTQDSPGHTSLTTPSLCTLGYLRQYLENGTLPEPGTVCPVEAMLFGVPGNLTASRRAALRTEDEQALAALKAVGDAVRSVITRGFGKRK